MSEGSIGTINKKIWNMADVLRDDGVSNIDYLEQITYLLFLKMCDEYSKPPYNKNMNIPDNCKWNTLISKKGTELAKHYKEVLETLGEQDGILKEIYGSAQNKINTPAMLLRVINLIDKETWTAFSTDVKGAIYEGLLEKTSSDVKSGAGQYFTPRPLINAMVKCVAPEPNKNICDPCCGSGGFLISSKNFVENNFKLDEEEKHFLKYKTFRGWEIVPTTYKMSLMNLFLHNISDFGGKAPITRGDSLLSDPGERFDFVLTNPPFGTKSTITYTNEEGNQEKEDTVYNRQDFWCTSSNKQFNFLQHIHTILKTNGKCAVVMPDNILFEEGSGGLTIRKKLLETTNLHTILRLPTGIFYKPGVKANVLFFDNKVASPNIQTKEIWYYDFRTGKHFTLKQNPLKESDLDEFVKLYCSNNLKNRKETWSKENPEGRWRKFTYDQIMNDYKFNLDISWIKDENEELNDMTLEDIFNEIKAESEQISKTVEELEKIINEVK